MIVIQVAITHGCERWETKFIPQEWTEIRQMVEVETRIDQQLSGYNVIPDVTAYARND